MGGDPVVVVKGRALLRQGEAVGQKQHGQHRVRLLADLMAVDHHGVIVQQQGEFFPGNAA